MTRGWFFVRQTQTIDGQTDAILLPVFRGMHVAPTKAKLDRWADGQTDRRWTKWSLCCALLRWCHKNQIHTLHVIPVAELNRTSTDVVSESDASYQQCAKLHLQEICNFHPALLYPIMQCRVPRYVLPTDTRHGLTRYHRNQDTKCFMYIFQNTYLIYVYYAKLILKNNYNKKSNINQGHCGFSKFEYSEINISLFIITSTVYVMIVCNQPIAPKYFI